MKKKIDGPKKKRDECMHVHEKKVDGPKKKRTDACMSIKKSGRT